MIGATIVANGKVSPKLLSLIRPQDFLIGVDKGAWYILKNNFRCDLAIGDFDSVSKSEFEIIKKKSKEIKIYPIEKDFTDMELALDEAVKRGFEKINILAAIGTRVDHTLANIFLLEKFFKEGIVIKIIDDKNEIEVINKRLVVKDNKKFKYISFFSVTETTKLTLFGFKYPLKNYLVKRGETLCLSNELLSKEGEVSLQSGRVIMIKSRD